MKRIIAGKRYDTDTATIIATHTVGAYGDFRRCREELYLTKSGAWFLHGEGGAMTRWATQCDDNSRSSGEGIEPIGPDQARETLEAWGETAALETYFRIVDA